MLLKKLSLTLLIGLALPGQQAISAHKTSHTTVHKERSYAVRQRMYNRANLLKSWSRKAHASRDNVVRGDQTTKAALRTRNRIEMREHPEWFPGPYQATNPHWNHVRDSDGSLYSQHLHETADRIVDKLEAQLGKPYVWGGTSPVTGFDCSGLVFFAYNKLLSARLPRTANEMYHFRRARPVAKRDLKRGDLVFFGIHSRGNFADHVGVYLGNGDFIEAPRSGLNIRISHFADDFWQDHYLGAKRILTANNIL